jgi:hypothetical protein
MFYLGMAYWNLNDQPTAGTYFNEAVKAHSPIREIIHDVFKTMHNQK